MKHNKRIWAFAVSTLLSSIMLAATSQGQTWTQLQGPSARACASAVFDPISSRMIMFAGNGKSNDQHDVWWLVNPEGPGLGWVQVKPKNSWPAPRACSSAVYDASNDKMIIFGGGLGSASPCANDVWVLSHAAGRTGTPTWNPLTVSGGPPAPRLRGSAVYDPGTNRMIVFGGNDCFSTNFNDVWVLSNANGIGGAAVWTQLAISGVSVGTTEDHTAVYDQSSNSMIVFGGTKGNLSSTNQVWLLSNANGSGTATWTELSPSGSQPLGRDTAVAVYDEANKKMTIYGGSDGTQTFSDAWVLSNADGTTGTPAWTQIATNGTAPARTSAVAIYNSATNQMTVFGGNSSPGVFPDGTFVLSDANGVQ